MKKYFLFPITVFFTSCLNPVLMRDPPNMNYELDKVGDLILTNSQMWLQKPLSTNTQTNEYEIIFKLFIKNSSAKNSAYINLKASKFNYLKNSINADCSFAPDNNSTVIEATREYKIDCKVLLSRDDISRLNKSDLIGELRIPLKTDNSKYLSSNIYIRKEELK